MPSKISAKHAGNRLDGQPALPGAPRGRRYSSLVFLSLLGGQSSEVSCCFVDAHSCAGCSLHFFASLHFLLSPPRLVAALAAAAARSNGGRPAIFRRGESQDGGRILKEASPTSLLKLALLSIANGSFGTLEPPSRTAAISSIPRSPIPLPYTSVPAVTSSSTPPYSTLSSIPLALSKRAASASRYASRSLTLLAPFAVPGAAGAPVCVGGGDVRGRSGERKGGGVRTGFFEGESHFCWQAIGGERGVGGLNSACKGRKKDIPTWLSTPSCSATTAAGRACAPVAAAATRHSPGGRPS